MSTTATPDAGRAARLFSFPNPVNEVSARLVAGGVVLLALAAIVSGEQTAADALLALVIVAATLESVFAFCIGCRIFALLMQAGVIPQEVCERCNDIWSSAPAPANRT